MSREKFKYNSYAELKAAYESGELDKDEHIIQLDNDVCYLYVNDEEVFRGGGYYDLNKLFELAGIPAEWV